MIWEEFMMNECTVKKNLEIEKGKEIGKMRKEAAD